MDFGTYVSGMFELIARTYRLDPAALELPDIRPAPKPPAKRTTATHGQKFGLPPSVFTWAR